MERKIPLGLKIVVAYLTILFFVTLYINFSHPAGFRTFAFIILSFPIVISVIGLLKGINWARGLASAFLFFFSLGNWYDPISVYNVSYDSLSVILFFSWLIIILNILTVVYLLSSKKLKEYFENK